MPLYSAIKKCAYQQFESKDAFSLHMVKDTADLLYAIACLLQRSVVKYVTCVIRRDFGMLLAKNCQKAKSHTHKEFAPVHGSSAHHSIIAIVTCVQKVII